MRKGAKREELKGIVRSKLIFHPFLCGGSSGGHLLIHTTLLEFQFHPTVAKISSTGAAFLFALVRVASSGSM